MRRTNTRDMSMYQSLCARQSVGRLGALLVIWQTKLQRTIPALHLKKQAAGLSRVAKAAEDACRASPAIPRRHVLQHQWRRRHNLVLTLA